MIRWAKTMALVLLGAGALACGGLEDEAAAEGHGNAKARYTFACHPYGTYARNLGLHDFRLTISGDHLAYAGAPGSATATRDPSYQPRKFPDRDKYVWSGHAPGPWQSPYILVQKVLRTGGATLDDGKKGGFGGIYFRDDMGGGTANFVCKR